MAHESHLDIRRTLVLLVRDGEVLLALKKRGFGEGLWNGVGGKIEAGETLEQAMVRETQEEIGVTPTRWHAVAELDFIQDAETDDPWHMYIYAYLCDEWDGKPSESEEMRPKWFNLDDIPYKMMWGDDPYWLPHILADKKVTGVFSFDTSNQLLDHSVKVVERLPHESA